MNGLLLAGQIEGLRTRKDKTMSLMVGLQELSPSKGGELLSLQDQVVSIYIKPVESAISSQEMKQVDSVDPEFKGKTQSQRIRSVLFVLFEHENEGFTSFDAFYKHKTEQYINEIKTKLPEQ